MAYRRSEAACARSQRTRDEVVRAARAVVAAEGIGGLSMVAVAAEAGVAVGSLYRHFASKTELVTEVVRATCAHELDVLRSIAESEGEPALRLQAAVSVFARRALSSGRVAYAMVCEPTVAEAELLRRAIRAEMAAILAGIVLDGIDRGAFPPQDAALSGVALVGAVSEVLMRPQAPSSPAEARAVVDRLVALALRAVGSAAAPPSEPSTVSAIDPCEGTP